LVVRIYYYNVVKESTESNLFFRLHIEFINVENVQVYETGWRVHCTAML